MDRRGHSRRSASFSSSPARKKQPEIGSSDTGRKAPIPRSLCAPSIACLDSIVTFGVIIQYSYTAPVSFGCRSLSGERTVKRLRLSKALTMPDSTTVLEACRRMAACRVDAALLTDSNALLCGILTDKDIATRVIASELVLQDTPVSKVMTRNPIFVLSDMLAEEALQKMVLGKFRHLPVVENGEVIALLDIAKCLYDAIARLERTVEKGKPIQVTVEGAEKNWGTSISGPGTFIEALREQVFQPSLSTIVQGNSKHLTVSPTESVLATTKKMVEFQMSSAIVTIGNKPLGILTSRDILMRVAAKNLSPDTTDVEKVCVPHGAYHCTMFSYKLINIGPNSVDKLSSVLSTLSYSRLVAVLLLLTCMVLVFRIGIACCYSLFQVEVAFQTCTSVYIDLSKRGIELLKDGVRFDINVLCQEAQKRWLKPSEVFFILQNYKQFPLTPEPPHLPPSGSLFLFNRKVLRFFRKDGYTWRKKKDGRTIGEAHERLKVGNVDALSCYYAHGEQNPYFQRRIFWMLDPAYGHIVLVHYREVAEGRYVSGSISNFSTESCSNLNQTSSFINADKGIKSGTTELNEPYKSSYSPGSTEEVSSKFVLENFEANHNNLLDRFENLDKKSQPEVNQALRNLAAQLSLDDDDDDDSIYFQEVLPAYSTQNESTRGLGHLHYDQTEFSQAHENLLQGLELRGHGEINEAEKQQSYASTQLPKVLGDNGAKQSEPLYLESPSWTDVLTSSSSSAGVDHHGRNSNFLALNDILDSSIRKDTLCPFSDREKISANSFVPSENLDCYKAADKSNGHEILESDLRLQLSATRRFLLGSENSIESPSSVSHLKASDIHQTSGEITYEASNRKENSTDWMGTIPVTPGNTTYTSEFSSMLFDNNHFGASLGTDSSLTVAQKQRFSIREISPEWAFSYESTKVIITGDFLCNPLEFPWAVMFGDIEVPSEIVQAGVLRCQTPQHSSGKVTLCVTSGNRESCSEVREFEFRTKPTTSSSGGICTTDAAKNSEELLLLARLVQMLLCGYDGSTIAKGAIDTQLENSRKVNTTDDHWQQIIEALQMGCDISLDTTEWIMQELLKDKLQNWLSLRCQSNEQTGCLMSKQEQGIIHLISGLGYEWGLGPILDFGVGINFRDSNGWTALHWAAHYGREKMVAALLAAGASAGLVTDPTAQDPVGKTPGYLASARGHKGLAGYLSEVALTSHLSSLVIEESEISKGSAEVEAERAVESISQRSVEIHGGTEDELSLKDSLAAVRNAAQAAARIQAAFRAHSFRKRQLISAFSCDDYGMTPGDIQELSAASKGHRLYHSSHDHSFDKAALSIQKKYRGWKGRKDFLTLRQNVVKIQAHVRGHQVRKKYREFVWTVGVIEKVILRWRRKGVGLRGFRAEPEMVHDEEEEDITKIFRKQKVDAALDEAVSRVLSMVDSSEARQQYRRMLGRYHQAKAEFSNSDEATSRPRDDSEVIDSDFIY
ncbi:unnamed protein product [Musa textilis]